MSDPAVLIDESKCRRPELRLEKIGLTANLNELANKRKIEEENCEAVAE